MKTAALVAAQIAGLLLVNQAGYAAASAFHLPMPGNLLGMLFLLTLLVSGAVPLRWFETTALFLIRHLAFFFIPITVGLMGFADIFVSNGAAILLTLVLSAALGIYLAGLVAQALSARRRRTP